MVSDDLDVLTHRGHLDNDFFKRLAAEYGRRKADIDRVAMAWRTVRSTTKTTHVGIHFGTVSGNVQLHAGSDVIGGDKHVTVLGERPSVTAVSDAFTALRAALTGRGGDEQRKIDRALEDIADELSRATPDRTEVAQSLARALKLVARVALGLAAGPAVAGPLVTLKDWLGPEGAYSGRLERSFRSGSERSFRTT
jgi:hypothetical protein